MDPAENTDNQSDEVDVRIKLEPDEEENLDLGKDEKVEEEPPKDQDDNQQEELEVHVKIEPGEEEDNDDEEEERADDEEEDDEDDHVKVTIDDEPVDYNLRAKQRQPQQAKTVAAIDLDAQQPILDVDINTLEDKPWRKPGADISDYFNYGFDEDTWKLYCDKQKKMKSIVNEMACSNSETTFKIPVLPTNEHSKYSPVRMIPTHVSNETRFNSWIPPTIAASSNEPEQEQNHDRLGDLDGGGARGHMDIMNLRDRELPRGGMGHQRVDHNLERMRDRDRKHEREREMSDRDRHRDHRERERERERDMERDPRVDRHNDRFDPEPRSDLRHRLDRVKEERDHVDIEHRSHSSSRVDKHHHSSERSDKHSDRLESKHSSERIKERGDKSSRDRSEKVRDRESKSSRSERSERSHREAAGSKKRDREDRSRDRGSDKRRKNR